MSPIVTRILPCIVAWPCTDGWVVIEIPTDLMHCDVAVVFPLGLTGFPTSKYVKERLVIPVTSVTGVASIMTSWRVSVPVPALYV